MSFLTWRCQRAFFKNYQAYRNENIFYQTKVKNYDYPYLENWEKTINFILKESKLI